MESVVEVVWKHCSINNIIVHNDNRNTIISKHYHNNTKHEVQYKVNLKK